MNACSQIYENNKNQIEYFSEKISSNIKSENSKEEDDMIFSQKKDEKEIYESEKNKHDEKKEVRLFSNVVTVYNLFFYHLYFSYRFHILF